MNSCMVMIVNGVRPHITHKLGVQIEQVESVWWLNIDHLNPAGWTINAVPDKGLVVRVVII